MAINFNAAIKAYNQAAGAAATGMPVKPAEVMGQDSFAAMVGDSLQQAVRAGHEAETLSMKQISGEADLKDVITAVANAEQTLETVVAVRDKVLAAYQEILKMPI
jgi:flagellar hook-basal body complex protein FliE